MLEMWGLFISKYFPCKASGHEQNICCREHLNVDVTNNFTWQCPDLRSI